MEQYRDINVDGYPPPHDVVEVWIEENEMPFQAIWVDRGLGLHWESYNYEVDANREKIKYWRPIRLDRPGVAPSPSPVEVDATDLWIKYSECLEAIADRTEYLSDRLVMTYEGFKKALAATSGTVDGPWRVDINHEAAHPESGCSGDQIVTITDGKVTLYVDSNEDEDGEQKLRNLLNQLKIKLNYDRSAEHVASHYQERIKQLEAAPSGETMRFVKASERLPEKEGEYCLRNPTQKWVAFVNPITIDRDYWILGEMEWLDESADHSIKDAMIDAIYEGAELWKQEYDDCRKRLQELVTLKTMKDTEGKTEEYQKRQPIAWQDAIEFLSQYQHLGE